MKHIAGSKLDFSIAVGNYRHCNDDWEFMCAAEHFACGVHVTADLQVGNYLEWTVYCPNKLEGIRLLVMLFARHRRLSAQIVVIHLLVPLDLHPMKYARRNSPTIADLCLSVPPADCQRMNFIGSLALSWIWVLSQFILHSV